MEALEKSHLVIAKVLDMAVSQGIQQWMLSFNDLGLDAEYQPFFYPCIEWLEAEGIIRVKSYGRTYGGVANGAVVGPVITAHGMNIMGQKLQVGEETFRVAEAVQQISAGKRSYSQFGDFVGGILGGLTKSLGS